MFHAARAAPRVAISLCQPTEIEGEYPEGVWLDQRQGTDPHRVDLLLAAEHHERGMKLKAAGRLAEAVEELRAAI